MAIELQDGQAQPNPATLLDANASCSCAGSKKKAFRDVEWSERRESRVCGLDSSVSLFEMKTRKRGAGLRGVFSTPLAGQRQSTSIASSSPSHHIPTRPTITIGRSPSKHLGSARVSQPHCLFVFASTCRARPESRRHFAFITLPTWPRQSSLIKVCLDRVRSAFPATFRRRQK